MKTKLVLTSLFHLVFVIFFATAVSAQEKTVNVTTEPYWNQNRLMWLK